MPVIIAFLNVRIAGGPFRNTTCHRKFECYQIKVLSYVSRYTDRYFYSKTECIYCHHPLGALFAKTELMKSISFDES